MILNIDVNRIFPHPNNPRQDLGELSELADSIKANGILQNLTIVPMDTKLYYKKITSKKAYPGDYYAVIGHRRHAAAKLAGLDKLPCTIAADMDEKTQVATMLLENIQRNDLTVYEQAQGFQLMLDFGESVSSISEKTGFSENTIKKRVKLLVLDKSKFQESAARGATLQDYAELDAIRNIEVKNSVLEKIGTPNFKYALKEALDHEKQADKLTACAAKLEKFAVPVDSADGLKQVDYFSPQTRMKIQKPDDTDTAKYYFIKSEYGIRLLKENTTEEIQSDREREEARQKERENRERLHEISVRAFQLRSDFIRNFKSAKKHSRDIMMFAMQTMTQKGLGESFDNENFLGMLNIKLDKTGEKDKKLTPDTVSKIIAASPERGLLIAAYCNYNDSPSQCYTRECEFKRDEKMVEIYSFLIELGYEMSDEERAFCNGTHELFVRGNEDNNSEDTEPAPLKAAS